MGEVVQMGETTSVTTPMNMIDRAVASGASIEMIEKLMGLQERWQANQARRAFDNAIAEAKAAIPVITKNRTVDFETKSGSQRTTYKHEDLAEISRTVTPVLAAHGLSYRFRVTSNVNEPVTVTCIISHRDGHFEETTLSAGRDDSGSKNSIQAIGSTLTYLQRMTLKAALGLAAAADDDGRAAGGSQADTINDDQAGELLAMIESTNADKAKFLAYFKVEKLADLQAKSYQMAVQLLNAKARK